MEICPLQLYAQKSNYKDIKKFKKISKDSICLEKDCNWYNKQKDSCLLIKSPYKLSYIQKTMQCI